MAIPSQQSRTEKKSDIMIIIDVCFSRFSCKRFVDVDEIGKSGIPIYPHEFEEMIKKHCANAREHLIKV